MPTRPATLYDVITSEAQAAKVPPELALAVAQTESNFDPRKTSPKGAQGIFQLMPDTAKEQGVDPADPVQNIRGGVRYLRKQLEASGGNVEQALARYNFGPGNVAKGRPLPKETQGYIQKVQQETDFRQWYGQHATQRQLDPNPDAPEHFYDYRAAHAAGAEPDETGHWPSQFKREGHPNLVINGIDTRTGQPAAAAAAQPEEGPPAVGQPPPAPEEKGWFRSMLESFDPRTPEGRRNLAGGAGAAIGAGLAPETGGLSFLIPVLGAALGGSVAETGEQVVGTPPPGQTGLDYGKIAAAGGEQGLYETGGQALMWPLRAVGKRLVAGRVGRAAAQHLSRAKEALSSQLQAGVDAASQLLQKTRTTSRQGVVAAGEAGRTGVQAAEAQAAAGATQAAKPYEALVGAPPPTAEAGRAANRVIQEGGAARARDQLGQAVTKAAESGPDVDITALKAEARRILSEEITPPQTAFPRKPVAGAGEAAAAEAGVNPQTLQMLQQRANAGDAQATTSLADIQAAMGAAQGAAQQDVLRHPAMGVLNRILNAEDKVPFAAAHGFKRELDEAVGSAVDRTVQKRVTNITKSLRGQLREGLAVHEPYNAATAAYAQVAPLYTKGMAPRLRKLAVESPEAIVRMISPTKPTHLRMLQDLLLHQAAEGGDAAGGQAAWDGVRSAWTHDKVVSGGIEKLGDRLRALEAKPEFHSVMYGDQTGTQVWENLKTVDAAYRSAVEHGNLRVEAAQTAGRQGRQAAREAGATAVEVAKEGVAGAKRAQVEGLQPIAAETQRLAESSLAPSMQKGAAARAGMDALRLYALGPARLGGGISGARLLRGPTADDLITWAIYSPKGTRQLVNALTSKQPALALADLARTSGILGPSTQYLLGRPPGPKQGTEPGTPPPQPLPPGEISLTMRSRPSVGTPPP